MRFIRFYYAVTLMLMALWVAYDVVTFGQYLPGNPYGLAFISAIFIWYAVVTAALFVFLKNEQPIVPPIVFTSVFWASLIVTIAVEDRIVNDTLDIMFAIIILVTHAVYIYRLESKFKEKQKE